MKNLTKQAERALKLAREAAAGMKHGYVGTEHMLLGLLREEEGTAGQVLRDAKVEDKALTDLIVKLIAPSSVAVEPGEPEMSPRAKNILEAADLQSDLTLEEETGTEHFLLAMLRQPNCVATRLLYTMGVNIQKLYSDVMAAMGFDPAQIAEELQNYRSPAGKGGTPTPVLDQYSRDLTAMARDGKLDPVIGREREISRIIQILSRRTKNNPCLTGEPGVGKTAVTEGLAQRIVSGDVPETVRDKRLVILDLAGMVAGTKYRGEFEERIRNIIDEIRDNQNILLFIDELHTIIGAGGAEGALDASNILKPSLSRGEIQLIGATTQEEYRKYIEKDAALERRFQPVVVEEPSEEEAVQILMGLKPYYERHHHVVITEDAVKAAVHMSARYISDRFLPDKAIDVMDEAASKVRLSGYKMKEDTAGTKERLKELSALMEEAVKASDLEKLRALREEQENLQEKIRKEQKKSESRGKRRSLTVTEGSIADIVSDWTRIPVSKLTESETKKLARLEKELHRRVIGQEEAVKAVAQAVKRGRVGLKDPNRPVGSFLFLGPTGVGKTELSKALAESVYGSEQSMIRVDMSEYMEKHSVSKLIGSPPGYVGYDEGGQLSEKVRRNPYSVILFDEIEKAHPDVFNILLQVLDEGHITDAHGKKIDFRQTIIIMTSNAGASSIISPKHLGFSASNDESRDYERMKSSVMEEVRRIFKPEFLNRIDEIIVFHTLNQQNIRSIVDILLAQLQKRCADQMDLTLKVTPSARNVLAEAGYDSKYGARPLRRAIQTRVEDALANEMLDGKIERGDTVTVRAVEKKLVFDKKTPEE